jgi:hypothetical protein
MTEQKTATMETIGVMMGLPASFDQGGEGIGLGFFTTAGNGGKLAVTAEMKKALDMGFRPMVIVKADPRNWFDGYELYLVAGLSLDVANIVEALAPMVMDKQFEDWRAWKAAQIHR